TIGAVFRTAARLDRDERRHLHLGRVEVQPMDALRVKDQFRKRKRKERAYLFPRPVVANDAHLVRAAFTRSDAIIHGRTMNRHVCKSKRGPRRRLKPEQRAVRMPYDLAPMQSKA